jgi:hypothetical protein
MKDIVCGMRISDDSAYRHQHGGKVFTVAANAAWASLRKTRSNIWIKVRPVLACLSKMSSCTRGFPSVPIIPDFDRKILKWPLQSPNSCLIMEDKEIGCVSIERFVQIFGSGIIVGPRER